MSLLKSAEENYVAQLLDYKIKVSATPNVLA